MNHHVNVCMDFCCCYFKSKLLFHAWFIMFISRWILWYSRTAEWLIIICYPSHSAHDVVATLNQRHWRWFNVATTSCAQWVGIAAGKNRTGILCVKVWNNWKSQFWYFSLNWCLRWRIFFLYNNASGIFSWGQSGFYVWPASKNISLSSYQHLQTFNGKSNISSRTDNTNRYLTYNLVTNRPCVATAIFWSVR